MSNWNIEDFLSLYSSHKTKQVYYSIYKQYFTLHYPELTKLDNKELPQRLNQTSLQYLNEQRDYRKYLLKFRKSIEHQAPKTKRTKLAALISYHEYNNIEFKKQFKQQLLGKNSEALSQEYIPSTDDIKSLCHYTPKP